LEILFIGDIVGRPGRDFLNDSLETLIYSNDIDFVIANGENAAGGFGLTHQTAGDLYDCGIDAITLGNHAFAKRDSWRELGEDKRIARPANYPPNTPGSGYQIFPLRSGNTIAVVNLVGRVFMLPVDCPFRTVDTVLQEIGNQAVNIIVDIHAEATSEKVAMGWYLDGRVSAVIGTHTHIQTSDDRILPRGTAYMTDAGMTGVVDGVLGMDKDVVVQRFITQINGKLTLGEGRCELQGVIISTDNSGKAVATKRVRVDGG